MSIYWGAYENGPATYGHYFGPTDPTGVAWKDGPWSTTYPENTWARFAADAGKVPSVLHWGQPVPWAQAFDAKTASAVVAKGAIPLIDTGENAVPADVAAGKYDAQITAWAKAVRAWGKPLFYRLWWEMNGGWYPWGSGYSASEYIAGWKHWHNLVNAAGATNVTWVWCPNVGSISQANARYPGDAYVDWVGLDGYNFGKTTESFLNIFEASYLNLEKLAPSKPIIIVETASQEYAPGVKASWITDAFKQLPLNFPKVKGACWFNWMNGKSLPIESSTTAQAAFKAAVASSYFLPGRYTALPFGKVPVPA